MRAFALTRHFSLLSLIFILIAGGSIGFLVQRHEIQQLETLVEDRNVVMTRVFLNVLSDDISSLLSEDERQDKHIEQQRLAKKISALILNSDIAKLKIYNLQGKVIFSTDPKQLGEDKSTNPAFIAARSGQVVSELAHREKFSLSEGEIYDVDLVSSYIPMQRGSEIPAVFELYQDVSQPLRQIKAGAQSTLVSSREVADATKEQSTASTSIAQRVEQIANMVEETTATIRGTAESAHELEDIAGNLTQLIRQFKT